MSFASIKAAISHLFGVEEAKAHTLVEAVVADAAPILDQFKTQVSDLIAEGHADVAKLLTDGLADVKADLAEIKALLNPAPVEPPAAG
jgi:hypothetical protein